MGSDASTVFFGGSGVRYAPESLVEGPMGVRGKGEAVSRVVILGQTEGFNVGGFDHNGAGGGREGSTSERAGKGVAGEYLIAESGGTSGLTRSLRFFGIGRPMSKNIGWGEP